MQVNILYIFNVLEIKKIILKEINEGRTPNIIITDF
jgi:hypothetical protein